MAITRSVWIDDDGTGTTGTILNNAELQKIYNNIDAMGAPPYQVIASTDTGAIAQWTPAGFGTRNAAILWTGTADATIQLLKSGIEGQIVTVRHAGATSAVLRFAQNLTPASGFAPFSNSAQSAPTPIAFGGYIQYFFTAGFWVIIAHEQGSWITPPFSAADYSWTVTAGQVRAAKYRLSGRTLSWNLDIYQSSLAAPGLCSRTIMGGFTAAAGNWTFTPSLADSSGATTGYGYHAGTLTSWYRSSIVAPIPAGVVSVFVIGQCEVT